MIILQVKKNNQYGFTLIELMIVVAIIGILASVAIPQYSYYMTKAKLASAASSISSVQTAVSEYYQTNGTFPTMAQLSAGNVNIVNPVNETITVTGGSTATVKIVFTTALGSTVPAGSGLIFTATPTTGDSIIKWVASQTSMTGVAADYVLTKLNGS